MFDQRRGPRAPFVLVALFLLAAGCTGTSTGGQTITTGDTSSVEVTDATPAADADGAGPGIPDASKQDGTPSAEIVEPECLKDEDCEDYFTELGVCEAAYCDMDSNTCARGSMPDDTPCDDEDVCTEDTICSSGVCGGGTEISCDDDVACTIDTCDPVQGCQHDPDPDCDCVYDSDCDDGLLCTIDTCDPELGCLHEFDPECDCLYDSDCRDDNPCTADRCDADGGCVFENLADGSPCPGEDVCAGPDTCQSGVCEEGPARNCDDGIACTIDTCDETGGCVHTPDPDCECETDDECTLVDPCLVGTCGDDNRCTSAPAANGTACVPTDPCVPEALCHDGVCEDGAYDNCDDGNVCTIDFCDPVLGCIHAPDGTCECGEDADCDDDNPCTLDACDDDNRCAYTEAEDGSACEGDFLCFGPDSCQAGLCLEGPALDCDDDDTCTLDHCDPVVGCVHSPDPACVCDTDADCDDGNACTRNSCTEEHTCAALSVLCDDGVDCTVDSCDSTAGCLVDASGCECESDTACDDDNACTDDTCVDYACSHLPVGDGTPCPDDGDACTTGHVCEGTACVWTNYTCPESLCEDEVDNDYDSLTDCADPDCAANPSCAERDCDNGVDDDFDGETDCLDMDCAQELVCYGQCSPVIVGACDRLVPAGTTGGPSTMDTYAGCGLEGASGAEFVYQLAPVTTATHAVISLPTVGSGGPYRLVLLADLCDTASCLEASDTQIEIDLQPGTTYYVVVDSLGDDGIFDLQMDCGELGTGCFDPLLDCIRPECATAPICLAETECDDGIDNNANGDTDCDDAACIGAPVCGPADEDCDDGVDNDEDGLTDCYDFDCLEDSACRIACPLPTPVTCGTMIPGTTTTGVAQMDLYPFCGLTGSPLLDGKETVFSFTPESGGGLHAWLTDTTTDLHVLLLSEDCDTYECRDWADGDLEGQEVAGGTTYHLVIDSAAGEEGDFNLWLQCDVSDETFCENGIDDDNNGQTDCDDSDCDGHPACAAPDNELDCGDGVDDDEDGLTDCADLADCLNDNACTCTSTDVITCGDVIQSTTVGAPSTVASYACDPTWAETGPERIFAFAAPADGSFTVTLSGEASLDADLFVLEEACNPWSCIAHEGGFGTSNTATFAAVAGETYFIVVDGYGGYEGPFTLTMDCDVDVELFCADGADDDGDDLYDCADPDCAGDVACDTACAARALTIGCNEVREGDTTGLAGTLGNYACQTWPEAGPEVLYELIPTANTTLSASVDYVSGIDLDIVLLDACDTTACLAMGDTALSYPLQAGHLYYLIVDGFLAGDFGLYQLNAFCD